MIRKIKILCLIILGLTAIYAIAGFFAIPMVLEKILPQKLFEALNRPVAVTDIRLNPFALSFSVEGFDMKDKNSSDSFVSFNRLFVNMDGMSLLKMKPAIEELSLEKPLIHLVRLPSKEFNFSDLIPPKTDEQALQEEKQPLPVVFAVSNIRILDGNVTFKDELIKKTHVFSPINFTLPFISNFERHVDTFVTPTLEGSINETGVSIQVETKPFMDTVETIVNLNLTGIAVPYYFVYAPQDLGFKITEGSIDLASRISLIRKNKDFVLTIEGNATLDKLAIVDRNGEPVCSVPRLKAVVSPSHPLNRQVKIASVIVEEAHINVVRDTEGKLNLLALGPPPPDDEANSPPAEAAPESNPPEDPFKFEVDQISLAGCKVEFIDHATPRAATNKDAPTSQMVLDNIILNVNGFSLAPQTPISFSLKSRLNNEASISADGQTIISPLAVDGKFEIGDISLPWIGPYIPENIRLAVTDGRFSASGSTKTTTNSDGKLTASVHGNIDIFKFSAKDRNSSESFASWDQLSLENVNFSHNPMRIDIGTIQLSKFSNRLVLDKDGGLNAQKIFKAPETPDGSEEPPLTDEKKSENKQDVVPVKIGEIKLKDFGVAFTDKKIEPNFSTRLNLSEARVSGLTTEGFKSAKIFAKGKIDDHAPIEIKGDVNPLGDDLYLDMTLDLSNLELSPFSPYTGKFIGRTIEKGKLKLDISDRVEKKNINGRLQIFLDQFTLGQNVDSPDALNLPVGLAVSLLKDRSGKITIDVPVTGRTDDPEYRPGGLVWDAIKNVITKAATSPFDLVASIAGGGEELRFIEFEPGSAQVNDANLKKLDAITTLMFERPGLMMDLSGFANTDKDRQAIAGMIFDKKMKELKYADLSKKEKASTPIEIITLTSEEYEEYLEELYETDVLSNPDNKAGVKKAGDKTLTQEEMKGLIVSQIKIDDNQLRELAADRIQQVKTGILNDGRVESSRVFLKETGALSPQAAGDHSASRVELFIK